MNITLMPYKEIKNSEEKIEIEVIDVPTLPCVFSLPIFVNIENIEVNATHDIQLGIYDDVQNLIGYSSVLVIHGHVSDESNAGFNAYIQLDIVPCKTGLVNIVLFLDNKQRCISSLEINYISKSGG
ncbi:hypothetical protein L2089_13840 [Paenibacillus hunanensis]|uniref:hypothetical protein n=1 Tax=Paenibacillus hunanensis TaxID=539262 RepID=UPI00202683B0|nr:hypothetical protein [Paenibacillus hunanensis]MCL9661778.1 hypothetical protein [Paenibacillus hunanensis]